MVLVRTPLNFQFLTCLRSPTTVKGLVFSSYYDVIMRIVLFWNSLCIGDTCFISPFRLTIDLGRAQINYQACKLCFPVRLHVVPIGKLV